jgi:hypothetical protein
VLYVSLNIFSTQRYRAHGVAQSNPVFSKTPCFSVGPAAGAAKVDTVKFFRLQLNKEAPTLNDPLAAKS